MSVIKPEPGKDKQDIGGGYIAGCGIYVENSGLDLPQTNPDNPGPDNFLCCPTGGEGGGSDVTSVVTPFTDTLIGTVYPGFRHYNGNIGNQIFVDILFPNTIVGSDDYVVPDIEDLGNGSVNISFVDGITRNIDICNIVSTHCNTSLTYDSLLNELTFENNAGFINNILLNSFECTDLNTCSIDALSDVDTTTVAPLDGQVLTWDNGLFQWTPGTGLSIDLNASVEQVIGNYPGDPTAPVNTGTGRVAGDLHINVYDDIIAYYVATGPDTFSNIPDAKYTLIPNALSLAGDTGIIEVLSNNDTLTVSGGIGLTTVVSLTDTVTINYDLGDISLTLPASIDPAVDRLLFYDDSTTTHHFVNPLQIAPVQSILDTNCIDLTLTAAGVLSADPIIAPIQGLVDNGLSCIPGEGLYVVDCCINAPTVAINSNFNILGDPTSGFSAAFLATLPANHKPGDLITFGGTPDNPDYVWSVDGTDGLPDGTVTPLLSPITSSILSLTLAGDIGINQAIANNDTITIAGNIGLVTSGSATDTVTISYDFLNLVDLLTTDIVDFNADRILIYNDSLNTYQYVNPLDLCCNTVLDKTNGLDIALSINGEVEVDYDFTELVSYSDLPIDESLDRLIIYNNSSGVHEYIVPSQLAVDVTITTDGTSTGVTEGGTTLLPTFDITLLGDTDAAANLLTLDASGGLTVECTDIITCVDISSDDLSGFPAPGIDPIAPTNPPSNIGGHHIHKEIYDDFIYLMVTANDGITWTVCKIPTGGGHIVEYTVNTGSDYDTVGDPGSTNRPITPVEGDEVIDLFDNGILYEIYDGAQWVSVFHSSCCPDPTIALTNGILGLPNPEAPVTATIQAYIDTLGTTSDGPGTQVTYTSPNGSYFTWIVDPSGNLVEQEERLIGGAAPDVDVNAAAAGSQLAFDALMPTVFPGGFNRQHIYVDPGVSTFTLDNFKVSFTKPGIGDPIVHIHNVSTASGLLTYTMPRTGTVKSFTDDDIVSLSCDNGGNWTIIG